MAIRRCPYCKAIIDEQDKYCNNCGTQLLFPEDEYVEEEIPGDKIIDDDGDNEEEQQEEKLLEEEPEEAHSGKEEKKETSKDFEEPEEEEESEEEGPEEAEGQEGLTEEEEPDEELEEYKEETGFAEKEEDKYPTPGETSFEEITEEEEEEKEDGDIEGRVEAVSEEPQEEEFLEQPLIPPQKEEVAEKYQVSIEEDELVFKTKDLDNLMRTDDEEKENLEELSEDFQERSKETKKPASDTKEELPPWVSGMKEGIPSGELKEEPEEASGEETGGEKTPTRPEWTSDSGIGIPERITQTQSGLPFTDRAAPATGEEHEGPAEEEEVEEEGEAGREPRRRPGVSLKLKAKLIDLVFITALWLISLWFTSQVIGVSFFRLFTGSLGPVLAFYFILLLLYFFLFLYFLGETLGDHYFLEED